MSNSASASRGAFDGLHLPEHDGAYRQSRYAVPPDATRVILVRHGESSPKVPGVPFPLLNGHGDPELSPWGQRQAVAVADRLRGVPVDAIYVSSLRRTHETAAPLAQQLVMDPVVEPDLREVFLGEWEGGLLREKVAAGDPVILEIGRQQRWDVIPGAEPGADFSTRLRSAIERIATAHRGGTVVAFVHGGVIGELVALTVERPGLAFADSDNGSISEIVVGPSRWTLRLFNETWHVRDI